MNHKNNPFIRHGAIVGVITILIILIGIMFSQQAETLHRDRDMMLHTQTAIRHIQLLLTKLEDAELGQRGYIISGETDYLEPYTEALKELPATNSKGDGEEQHRSISQEISYLRELTKDNPVQRRTLDELDSDAKELLKYLDSTIQARKSGHVPVTDLQKLDLNYGKQLMDGIRQEIAALTTEEGRLLSMRTLNDEAHLQWNNLFAFLCIALFYATVLATIWVISRRELKSK